MTHSFEIPEDELEVYKKKVEELNGTLDNVTEIIVDNEDDNHVKLTWVTDEGKKIERIRRITGYLVGDMSRWNEGKKAEERDRVKHG